MRKKIYSSFDEAKESVFKFAVDVDDLFRNDEVWHSESEIEKWNIKSIDEKIECLKNWGVIHDKGNCIVYEGGAGSYEVFCIVEFDDVKLKEVKDWYTKEWY